jgi:hypothetical protein
VTTSRKQEGEKEEYVTRMIDEAITDRSARVI